MRLRKTLIICSTLFIAFISKADPIDTNEIVTLEECHHFVSYKGEDSKPVLLILHGGPGRTLRRAADMFNDQLVKNFIVVHWDQRRTEMGDSLNPDNKELTIELLRNDAELMVDYLCKRFSKEKLFVATHSWGSEMGLNLAANYPEKIHALIAISPVVDQQKNTEWTIDMLKKWALENENEQAIKELDSVNVPIKTKSDLFYQQKWLFIHNEVGFASLPSFRGTYFEWMDVWFPLVYQQGQKSLMEQYSSFNCPIIILEGKGDGMETHYLAKDFYKHLDAPKKHFVWFKKSGHTVFNTEPEKLQKVIIKFAEKYHN